MSDANKEQETSSAPAKEESPAEAKAEQKPDQDKPKAEEDKKDEKDAKTDEGEGGDWWGWGASAVSSITDRASKTAAEAVQVAKSKSNEVYGLMSKDLTEVSAHASNTLGAATNSLGATASTIKKSLVSDWYYCDSNSATCYNYHADPDVFLVPDEVDAVGDSEFDEKTDVMADKAVESVRKGVSSLWSYASGYASQMFSEEDLPSEAMMVGKDNNPVLLDRLQAQLFALSSDPDTFLNDPDPADAERAGLGQSFSEWPCDLVKRQGEISDLMMSNANVRKHYTDMVPDKVTHKVFWTRYFYKVHLIELQEAKRQALRKRAEMARQDSDPGINWDDVGDLAGGNGKGAKEGEEEIPTEVQDKLLSDYERELITEKMKKGQQKQGNGKGKEEKSLDAEMAKVKLLSEAAADKGNSNRSSPGTNSEKESVASDEWEKLSSGERSPKKQSKQEVEEDWVKT